MQGIIIENISNKYIVEVDDSIIDVTARGKLKKDNIIPVVGDRVEVNIEQKTIEKIYERVTYIKRPKVANITQLIYVISIKDPKPDLLMLDKQLVYAEWLNIKPIIVINKIDLGDSFKEIEEIYTKSGYKVILTNAKQKQGIDEIKKVLKNNISVFSGNSGVGKSTTINSLFNDNITEEGEISKKNKRGKNTTTSVKLYKIDEASYIADTPGFSNFDIFEIKSNELEKYFIEFRNYIKNCEFVGCTHIKEENCGIKQAVRDGKITKDRYNRFCTIYNELKEKEERRW